MPGVEWNKYYAFSQFNTVNLMLEYNFLLKKIYHTTLYYLFEIMSMNRIKI